LHKPLTVVKGAGHFQCGDIFAERRELLLLRDADAVRGIKNHNANPWHAKKSLSDGAPGIARRRCQHSELPRLTAHEVAHQLSQEARAEVLERQRWPVK